MANGAPRCGVMAWGISVPTTRAYDRAGGFTLIEVLVALTIVALALGASLRAVATLTSNSQAMQQKLYASWSAENRLAELRLGGLAPASGQRGFDCPQGRLPLYCVEEVRNTANVYMRRVELQVYANASRTQRILSVATVMANR
jgi:general secretion pathway protein I